MENLELLAKAVVKLTYYGDELTQQEYDALKAELEDRLVRPMWQGIEMSVRGYRIDPLTRERYRKAIREALDEEKELDFYLTPRL